MAMMIAALTLSLQAFAPRQDSSRCIPEPAGIAPAQTIWLGLAFAGSTPASVRENRKLAPPLVSLLEQLVDRLPKPAGVETPAERLADLVRLRDRRFANVEAAYPSIDAMVRVRVDTAQSLPRPANARHAELARSISDTLVRVLVEGLGANLLRSTRTDSLDLQMLTFVHVGRDPPFPARPWFTMDLPTYRVQPVRIMAQPDPDAVPVTLRSATGTAEVRFNVRPDSTADMGSVVLVNRIGEGDHELHARHLISTMRFAPALIGGCPTSQWVQQRIRFNEIDPLRESASIPP